MKIKENVLEIELNQKHNLKKLLFILQKSSMKSSFLFEINICQIISASELETLNHKVEGYYCLFS